MTAQVSNQHSYTAMPAMIVDQHPQEVTLLAQTGGNNHISQNSFAQTQPTISEMSTQTEAQIEEPSAAVQQITQNRDRFVEGQEHTSAQCNLETT